MQDGTRGSVIAGEPIRELRDGEWIDLGERWRRPLPDGSWNDGDVRIEEGDVRFIDGPRRTPWQLGIRSPDDAPDLEADLMASPQIAVLVKDIRFATDLYRAMCNTDWYRNGVHWATTWRLSPATASNRPLAVNGSTAPSSVKRRWPAGARNLPLETIRQLPDQTASSA